MRKRLTSRERILRAFHHEPVDRVPVSPFGMGRLGYDHPLSDTFIATTDPFLEAGLGGSPFVGTRFGEFVASHAEGSDTVTEIRTPGRTLVQRYRRTEKAGYTVEFPCKNAEDVCDYLRIPFEPSDPDPTAFLARQERYGEEGLVLAGIPDAICFLASILSPEDFCLLWADEPDLMRDATNIAQERLLEYVEKACRKGVDAYRIVGGEYATTQLGPAGFEALCAEQDRELVALIHRYGGIAYYHNHGPMARFLEYFPALGIDALDPVEVFPYGDITLAEAKRRIGDQVCLVGGLDDMEVLETRDEATIRKLGRACLEAAGPIGYCLGGTASGTYTERAARHFMALVEVAEEFGSG